MISTNRQLTVNLMDLCSVNLSPIPIYGIAYINSLDHIVQHMNKETQHNNQECPCENCYNVWINPHTACTFQDSADLFTDTELQKKKTIALDH